MRIVIIGSVAGGTSAAAKARRNSEDNEIVIYEMDSDISYSGCGLTYYIGEEYITRDDLTPRNPAWFKKRFNIDIFTRHKVTGIDPLTKTLTIKKMDTGEIFSDRYDKLIMATGAKPVIPSIPGVENKNVFPLRNVLNADNIKNYIAANHPEHALIIGGGFIGLEMAESLSLKGISVTLAEMAEHVMPSMDYDMALYIEEHLRHKGVKLVLNDSITGISEHDKTAVTSGGKIIQADMIILAAGAIPNLDLLTNHGITTGIHGGIIVNEKLETNIPDIYAVGDCCEVISTVTGDYIYRPLGSTANKMGRIAGDLITGGDLRFKGIPGTGIFKTFDLTVAQTGLTEKEARDRGFDIVVSHNIKENQSRYMKESRELVIKCIIDRNSEKILGVQIIGERGVDKRIDVFVTAMAFGAKIQDLFHLDLAYAPPFSTTKDPVIYSGMILDNALHRKRKLITAGELIAVRESCTVIDVRSPADYGKGHIDGAVNIPYEELKFRINELVKNDRIVVHCNKGNTGNAAQNLLLNIGFKEVYNLSGGYNQYKMLMKKRNL